MIVEHDGDRFTVAVFFTSESAAWATERQPPAPEGAARGTERAGCGAGGLLRPAAAVAVVAPVTAQQPNTSNTAAGRPPNRAPLSSATTPGTRAAAPSDGRR